MLIEIHAIQNHSPNNLNRDDLGAPKTCYFGGVLRSRISSQCIKRSIRTSEAFIKLRGGIRTRQLARLIEERLNGKANAKKAAISILNKCGIKTKDDNKSDMLVYTTQDAIDRMADLLRNDDGASVDDLATAFGRLIATHVASPDMALSGRMLETGVLQDTTVEAALQVAHAISTHAARPEVDYYVAADDIPGDDAGAGYVDEAMFASACFYKYFSIDWEQLVGNLNGNTALAAHTVGAFLRAAAETTPTGKQNSFAAHNRPDALLVEIRDTPISYANAFARPVEPTRDRDLIAQSVAQLAQHIHDLDVGFGAPGRRFWFSPNLRHRLTVIGDKQEQDIDAEALGGLDALVQAVVAATGHDWETARRVVWENSEVVR